MSEEASTWANYKRAEITVEQFLEQQSVEVGDTPPEGETRAYRNAYYPQDLVEHIPTRPNCTDLYQLLEFNVKNIPDSPYLGTRKLNEDGTFGPYEFQTYAQVAKRRKNLGDGFMALEGIEVAKGSTIGIFSKNRAEWVLAEHASYCHSLIPVALYDTLGANAVSYVIEHAEMPICVCSGDHISSIIANRKDYPILKLIVTMESEIPAEQAKAAEENDIKLMTITEVEALGAENEIKDNPSTAHDLATIMYTSGSTGNPKGVQLTHRAFFAVCAALYYHDVGPILFGPKVGHFSYLPLAHSFERACCAVMLMGGGRIGFFTGDLKNLLADLGEMAPDFMIGAPRVYQRIHDRINAKVGAGSFIKRAIFNLAFWWKRGSLTSGGHAMAHNKGGWTDSLVFGKTEALLGGNCKFILSGSAPLDPEVGQFLRVVLCVPILQGYGLTENCAGASVSSLNDCNSCTHVGPPIASMEIKLVDVEEMNYTVRDKPYPRGEVCLRGPTVFTGYFKDPEKTAQDLQEDGWFHTGDIGQFGKNNVLQIIDRKKNIFKLSQGEYVAAEYLETVFTRSPLVQQIFVYGDSLRNYLVGVVVPSPDTIPPVAKANGVSDPENMEEVCKSDGVRDAVMESIVAAGKAANLHGFEFVKKIYLEHDAFSVENDLLTPTFKPKRVQLKAKYKETIDSLYG